MHITRISLILTNSENKELTIEVLTLSRPGDFSENVDDGKEFQDVYQVK